MIIAIDPGDPDVMHRPPRDPAVTITNRTAVLLWIVYGAVLFVAAFIPLVAGPDEPSTDHASVSMTMTFVVMGLGTVFNAVTNRRDPGSGLAPPLLAALAVALVPVVLVVLATQLPGLQRGMLTTSLTGPQWLAEHRPRARAPDRDRGRQVDPPPARAGGDGRIDAQQAVAPRVRAGRIGAEVNDVAKKKHSKSSDDSGPQPRMKEKEYQHELRRLHGELVAMQEWVKASGAKVCIVFEGRDTAGKGGTIKAITERVSPRVFRVVALPAPTDREKSQMYVQRYIRQFPSGGEVVIFDRSWYNRAGVERVMGFCTEEQTRRFLEQVPAVEKAMVESGILLVKYWLEVSPDEQTRRLESRIDDPRKVWKLTEMDLKSYTKWDEYSRARDDMFAASDTPWAPWYVAHSDDKKRAAPQRDHAPPHPDPLRRLAEEEGGATEAPDPRCPAPRGAPRCASSPRRTEDLHIKAASVGRAMRGLLTPL